MSVTEFDTGKLDRLTCREREVLRNLARAEPNRALARRLGIAERTVKAHITSLVRKLELDSRLEATLVSMHYCDDLTKDSIAS
ncbi:MULTISPECIES: LuxR C-terminal-related transcriptional regulator [unclassified Streptomyces]|uniref:helix-turn-helix domain-containing protein n=1 Tax=unclassified Streptomyces TaxID=2593676 RepID=UPI0033335207